MNRLKELRKKNKLTQKELAEILGVCKDYVSNLERGKQTPGRKLEIDIANFFCVNTNELNFFEQLTNKTFDKKII